MCGFAAYFGPDGPGHQGAVARCAALLAHRGPDGAGTVSGDSFVLSHRRLAIIDVGGGRQPMIGEGGKTFAVCNGEIYNHQRLRDALGERHRLASRSDSEVLVHLYEELGPALVDRLDGMFAFVVTDGERLVAARDALGIKPLYVGRDAGGGTWLASELKALVGVCDTLDELPPGHLYLTGAGVQRWFEPPWREPPADPLRGLEAQRAIAQALEEAVRKRLMSDVPLGVLLSGGLDSSLVAALVTKAVGPPPTFAVGLEGSSDLAAARKVAAHLGTQHHEHVFSAAEAVAAIEPVIEHLESYDPALVRSAVPCYLIARLAARHVKVVLTGEGADELFAGYRHCRDLQEPDALHREAVRLLLGLHDMNLQRVDRMTMAHGLEGRVPFLDLAFVEVAMRVDPAEKLHSPRGALEKSVLRRSFKGLLPDHILWRPKQEFADGAGAARVLQQACARLVDDAEVARARELFPVDPPTTAEELHYRRIFARRFPGEQPRQRVRRWRGGNGA